MAKPPTAGGLLPHSRRLAYGSSLLLACTLVLVALGPLGSAATQVVNTFSDGTSVQQITIGACPLGILEHPVVSFDIPGDAHIWTSTLTATITNESEGSSGYIYLLVGPGPGGAGVNTTVRHGNADNASSATVSGRGFSFDLFAYPWPHGRKPMTQGERSEVVDFSGDFNSYLNDLGRGTGRVRMAVTLTGCGDDGALTVRLDRLAIVYSTGYTSNEHPKQVKQVPPVNVPAGGEVLAAVDLLQYFTDAEGDRIRFSVDGYSWSVHYENGSSYGWWGADNSCCSEVVLRDGHLLDAYSRNASWRGSVWVDICVNDAVGCVGEAANLLFTLTVVDPAPAGVLPASTGIFAPPRLDEATTATPLSFRLSGDGPLPLDAQFVWYLDGEVIGRDSAVGPFTASAGKHVVHATATTGGSSETFEILFAVAAFHATLPASDRQTQGLVLSLGAGVFGLAAASYARSETGRYRILWLLMSAVHGGGPDASVLDHFVRGQIYQAILDEPGVHFSEILRRARVGNGTAVYHLHRLEQAGLVRVVVDGALTRFYPTDRPLDKRTYELTGRDRETLKVVEELPGISQKEIAGKLRKSGSAVSRSIRRLAVMGYVTVEAKAGGARVFPRPGDERPSVPSPSLSSD